ncbi:MAG: SCO family protein [Dinghuibacter sp.]|nr:SCO family protein [Dinghuibacter sp.]
MSKVNTTLAVLVCILLPVISYFIIKRYTDNHVQMPRKYFYDGLNNDTVRGKKQTDTNWHQVKNFNMVNQYGDTVNLDMLAGKVLIVDFFFTHCPTICPALTRSMKMVQHTMAKDTSVHLISITIDPDRDSVPVLRNYAQKNGINKDNWWICRIVGDSLEKIMYTEFKAGFQADSVYQFDHTADIYLLDKKRIIRGKPVPTVLTEGQSSGSRFYDGTDSADVFRLINDAGLVKMEKTERKPPPIKYMLASMVLLGLMFFIMLRISKKKKNQNPLNANR